MVRTHSYIWPLACLAAVLPVANGCSDSEAATRDSAKPQTDADKENRHRAADKTKQPVGRAAPRTRKRSLLDWLKERQLAALQKSDAARMRWHYQDLLGYRELTRRLPKGKDQDFLRTPWVRGICPKTRTSLEMFFASSRLKRGDVRKLLQRDPKEVWRSLDDPVPKNTGFVGRGSPLLEPWQKLYQREIWIAAMDADGKSLYPDGAIFLLLEDGTVVRAKSER